MITILLLVCATCIWVSFFAHISFMVNRTFNAMPMERLQHPKWIFGTDLKNVITFVTHFVFGILIFFGFQLPSLTQAYKQQKVAL